jgi:hypothetical protein
MTKDELKKQYEEFAIYTFKKMHRNPLSKEWIDWFYSKLQEAVKEERKACVGISQLNWSMKTMGKNHPKYEEGWIEASERIAKAIESRKP